MPVLEYACRQAPALSPTDRAAVPLGTRQPYGNGLSPASPDDREEAERLLSESVSGLQERFPDVRITLETTVGLPEDALLRRSAGMDMLVVGRRERTLLDRVLFSSSTVSVVEHSSTTVAVVPLGPGQG